MIILVSFSLSITMSFLEYTICFACPTLHLEVEVCFVLMTFFLLLNDFYVQTCAVQTSTIVATVDTVLNW